MMVEKSVHQYGNLSVDMMARHIPMNVLQIMTLIARYKDYNIKYLELGSVLLNFLIDSMLGHL